MGLFEAYVFMTICIVVPYALLGTALWAAWKASRRGNETRRLFLFYPVLFAFFAGTALGIYGHIGILSSHSSTAAVGFFFLPFWMAGAAVVGWLMTILVMGTLYFASGRPAKTNRVGIGGSTLALLLLIGGAAALFHSQATAEKAASTAALEAARSPALNESEIPRLLGRAREGDLDLVLALASNPAMPTQGTANLYMYAERAPDSDPRKALILQALAGNEHTADPYLQALARKGPMETRLTALANPSASYDLLNTFSHDKDPIIRAAVAAHPQLDSSILKRMAHDPDETVRAAALENIQRRGLPSD